MSDYDFAIETSGLTRRFRKRLAVNGLDLQVPAGSVFAFLGRNGAGKTTTIRMLLNLLSRNGGDARVLGLDPRRDDFTIKQRAGYVAEGQRMVEWMTVAQTLWFCKGFYPTWDDAFAAELLRSLELRPEDRIGNLSRGGQAKVALLLAMAFRPELLILDEPTAGLDLVVRREFLEGVIDLLQQEGRTVFFSSHLVHEVERVADWVGIVDGGRLIVAAPIEELQRSVKRLTLTFPQTAPATIGISGMLRATSAGRQVSMVVRGEISESVKEARCLGAETVRVEDMGLEELFIAFVGGREVRQ